MMTESGESESIESRLALNVRQDIQTVSVDEGGLLDFMAGVRRCERHPTSIVLKFRWRESACFLPQANKRTRLKKTETCAVSMTWQEVCCACIVSEHGRPVEWDTSLHRAFCKIGPRLRRGKGRHPTPITTLRRST
eukprot:3240428-Prymnesium_polylepis.1